MNLFRRICFGLFWGLAAVVGSTAWGNAQPTVLRVDIPSWVELLELSEASVESREIRRDGVAHLLYETQNHIGEQTTFERSVYEIVSSAGLQYGSRISFDVDPVYETLSLHKLQIVRNGDVIDLRDTQVVRKRQREENLEWHLYDGRWNVELLIEGTRPGDIIEYAISIRGHNPVFNGLYSTRHAFYFWAPIQAYRYRIHIPASERSFEVLVPPGLEYFTEVEEGEGERILSWTLRHVQATQWQPDAPVWYEPYDIVEISEHPDWASVAAWGTELYALPRESDLSVTAIADELKAEYHSAEERILNALRYVQNNVRYVSLQWGLHSHKPNVPETVVTRLFGDCKDKSVLLCAVLREMDIEAWPALVNTLRREHIQHSIPSSVLFDHVIVHVEINGRTYWIDPAMKYQGGALDHVFISNYGKALVLRPGESDLRSMSGNGYESASIEVREVFTMPEQPEDPVRLDVETVFSGHEADLMRSTLDGMSLDDLQRRYLQYYVASYRAAEPDGRLRVTDDLSANRLIISESWILPDPWETRKNEAYPLILFNPTYVREELSPRTVGVTMQPMRVQPARHLVHHVKVVLPEDMLREAQDHYHQEHDAFTFTYEEHTYPQKLELRYEYRSFADHVPGEHVASFIKALEEPYEWTHYFLYHPWSLLAASEDLQLHAKPVIMAATILILFVVLALSIPWWAIGPHPDRDELLVKYRDLNGIGGWLIFPIFGMIVAIIMSLSVYLDDGIYFFDASAWVYLTDPQSEGYVALWETFVVMCFIEAGVIFGFVPILWIHLFRKTAAVRYLMPLLYATFIAISVVMYFISVQLPQEMSADIVPEIQQALTRSVMAGLIWIPYFLVSKRVKITYCR